MVDLLLISSLFACLEESNADLVFQARKYAKKNMSIKQADQ